MKADPAAPMKIAVLVNQYPKTSHSFIRREIAGLERAGIEVVRVSIRATGEPLVEPLDRAERERTRVILAHGAFGLARATIATLFARPAKFARALRRAIRMGRRSDRGVLVHGAYLAEACVLARWCRELAVEHVHAHFVTNPPAVALLARELGGAPFSFTAHGTNSFRDPRGQSLTDKIGAAEFVVGVSARGAAELRRHAPAPDRARVHVVRCGTDASFLDHPAVPPPPDPRIVCVARLDEAKGLAYLIDAAAELARGGLEFQLVLVGDGDYRATLERKIEEHGLREHVVLAGWLGNDAVRARVLAARALVLPSLDEGLPVVIMEALALRRPVVATDVGAVSELVETGVDGWLVPPREVAPLAAALRDALTRPIADLARMGERGRERVLERHDALREARSFADVLRASRGGRAA